MNNDKIDELKKMINNQNSNDEESLYDNTEEDLGWNEDFSDDIIDFCLKKKYKRDENVYGKPRNDFFDDHEMTEAQKEAYDAEMIKQDMEFWRRAQKYR